MDIDILDLQIKSRTDAIIKVIGVGGGGGNAVNHMFKEGIHDVSFALCNTDNQALLNSPVPVKVQLGEHTTGGLGAGNKPELAQRAAEESTELIQNLLSDGTRMAFITAGMGEAPEQSRSCGGANCQRYGNSHRGNRYHPVYV